MKVADTRKWDSEWPNIATPLSRSGLARSVWPLVWGVKTQKTNSQSPPVVDRNSLQNLDTNWGPLSETTSAGRPWSKDVINYRSRCLLGWGQFGQGNKMGRLREPVHYGKTTVLPREGGRAVTKSSAIWDQGLEGTDSGWSNPSGGRLEVLPRARLSRPKQTLGVSRAMARHQNRCLIRNMVRPIPGWQATLEQWPHWMTLDRNPSGTNNRPVGHPGGGRYPFQGRADLRFDLPSDCRDNHLSGIMHSGDTGRSEMSKIRDKASGLMFLEPGR